MDSLANELPAEQAPHGRINAALLAWRQGDCILGDHWFTWQYEPMNPVTEGAVQAKNSGDSEYFNEIVDQCLTVDEKCPGFAILTQTCDIVRDCSVQPFLEVCPLILVDDAKIKEISKGKRPGYAFLAGIANSNLVADLNRVMTVEKPVVVNRQRVEGCLSDQDRRDFAMALSRKRSRFAFPDQFNQHILSLPKRLQDRHKKNTLEGDILRQMREIRVQAYPSWNADVVKLRFYFVIKEDADKSVYDQAHKFKPDWEGLIPNCPKYPDPELLIVYLEDITAQDYVHSYLLDLDHLTLAIRLSNASQS